MSKNETYTQVKLVKDNCELVTFVDTKYANTDFQIELEDRPGVYWDIEETYPDSKITSEQARERSHRWSNYRMKADI